MTGDRYVATPAGTDAVAFDMIDLGHGLTTASYLELSSVVRTAAIAGIVFDGYAANDLKFAAIDVPNQKVLIGHIDPRRGFVIDASVSATLSASLDYTLSVSLKGSTVSVSLNGSSILANVYNAAVVDGSFGTLAKGGEGKFDVFRYRTNDDAWRNEPPRVFVGDASIAEGNSSNTVVTLL